MSAPVIEATTVEFVALNAHGRVVENVAPYLGHTEIQPGVFRVADVFGESIVEIPRGGSYSIRGVER